MNRDLVNGSILHCLETATLGMPLEAWKTRLCVYRNENTVSSFLHIYRKGLSQFYAGFTAKLVESASKGGVLLISKEKVIDVCNTLNVNKTTGGFIGGACGGICQSLVMTPCTFFITASIDKKISYLQKIKYIFKQRGIVTLYKGNTAMCLRQGTNWASRQGITEFVRNVILQRKKKKIQATSDVQNKNIHHIQSQNTTTLKIRETKEEPTLNIQEEVFCGIIGGTLSVWNNPFDVIRVHMQSNANKNINLTFFQSFLHLYKEGGLFILYKGVIPRCLLCIWQTLFMVTGVKIINRYY